MAALQLVGSVGSVGSGWIGSLFHLHVPPTYLTFQSVCRCLISVEHGRYLRIGEVHVGHSRLFLLVR